MADVAISPVYVSMSGTLVVPLMGNPIGLWEGLRAEFLRMRPRVDDPRGAFPATTNRDVSQLLEVWARSIRRDYIADRDVSGYRSRWEAYTAPLARVLASADPSATFADNRALWLDHSLDLARGLSLMYVGPSTFSQTLESVAHGAETLVTNAPAIALGFTGQVASAVNRVGATAGAGLWNSVKVPLALGAAVLGAIVIIPLVVRRPGGS